jgi:adenylate cyclase
MTMSHPLNTMDSLTAPGAAAGATQRRAGRCVLVIDIVEFVRLMEQDEAGTVERSERLFLALRQDAVLAHRGRVVKSTGDGLLAEFPEATAAAQAAWAAQALARLQQPDEPEERQLRLRIAATYGDVWDTGHDIQGKAVNLAARLVTLAGPGEIVVSAEFRDRLQPGLDAEPEDLGECFLKHLSGPVRAFRLAPAETSPQPKASGPGEVRDGAADPLRTGVVVLPLVDVLAAATGVGTGSALGDLIADEVRGGLSRSAHLHVIARMSCNQVAARGLGLAEIGLSLAASYVLSGTVRRQGERVRVRVELARTADHSVIWADALEADVAAVLAGDDPIVPAVVGACADAILREELDRATTLPMPNLRSHSLLLAGIGLIHRSSRSDFERAERLLEHLAQRHPRRPQAHALLGQWHAMRSVQGLSTDPQADARRALDTANRALEVDSTSALALSMKGLVHGFLLKDLDAAGRLYEQALQVNPNEALAWLYQGTLRGWQGRGDEAWAAATKALALSPVDPLRYYFDTLAAFAALTAGRLEDAERLARRSLRAHRLHTATHRTLAIAQALRGDEAGARATVAEMLRLEPGFSVARYRARFPGGETPMALRFAELLRAAGAPD